MKRNLKVTAAVIAILVIAVGGYWLSGGFAQKYEEKTIKIGAILPLSGNLAAIGVPERNVLDLTVDELNEKQDKYRYEIIFEDSKGNAGEGATIANKLISLDKVDAIFVSLTSVVNAVGPIAQKNDVLVFANAMSSQVPAIGDGIFRFFPSTQNEVDIWFQLIKEKEYKRVGMLYINAEYALEEKDLLQAGLSPSTEFYHESFEITDKDFKSHLLKMKQNNVDAIVVSGLGLGYVTLVNQVKELKLDADILGDIDFALAFAKGGARRTDEGLKIFDGVQFAMFATDMDSPKLQSILQEYTRRYQSDVLDEAEALLFYDALKMLDAAIQETGGFNVKELKRKLSNIDSYQGVTGTINIVNRSADIPLKVARYENGKIVF